MTFHPGTDVEALRRESLCCSRCSWNGTGADVAIPEGGLLQCPTCDATLERAEAKVFEVKADRVVVTIGTFACQLSAAGFGTVTLDGHPVPVRRLSIESKPGQRPTITLEVSVLPVRAKGEGYSECGVETTRSALDCKSGKDCGK